MDAHGCFSIGVVSDTHGILRPEAEKSLQPCDLIVHAGDIGAAEILDKLKIMAPVVAVRGNMDSGLWAADLPTWDVVEIRGRFIYVIHDVARMDADPVAAGFDAVITGHSHRPENHLIDGVLYFNPGSAGPRRFRLPVTVGRLTLTKKSLEGKIITLLL